VTKSRPGANAGLYVVIFGSAAVVLAFALLLAIGAIKP
jgi:hypothetical protein